MSSCSPNQASGADNVKLVDTASNDHDVSRIERADASVELTGTTTPADTGTTGAGDARLTVSAGPAQNLQWSIRSTGSASQAGGWPGVAGADGNVEAVRHASTGAGVVVAVIDSGYSPRTPTSQVRSGRTTVKRAAMAPTTTTTSFAGGAVHQQTNRC